MPVIGVLLWLRLLRLWMFVLLGLLLWLAMYQSGVHAAIAGALLGLSAPIVSRSKNKWSIAGQLERALIPVSTFVVVPLFALANAGVTLSANTFQEHESILVGAGIIAGLAVGKVVGITGAAWLVVRFTSARLPKDVTWPLLIGASLLAGTGFTLSIFIAEVAFVSGPLEEAAKVGIFIASWASAVVGLWWLWRTAGGSVNADHEA